MVLVTPTFFSKGSIWAARSSLSKRSRLVIDPTTPKRTTKFIIRAQSSSDKPDIIESFVGKLFGQGALKDKQPGGLKRLTAEDTPEMWPATTDEFTSPLPDDPKEIALLRPLLAKTQMEKVRLRCAFSADIHGWSCAAFHQCVDTFGATLIVATTKGGAIIGGYNPRGFIGLGEDRDSIAAFLFTWPNGDLKNTKPIKLPKVGGASLAVVDKQEFIQFGAEGLTLLASQGNEKMAKCRLGTYYARMPDGSRTLFAKNEDPKRTELVSLKAYVMEGEGEKWNLDGVVWNTKV